MFSWTDGVGDDVRAAVSDGLDRMAKLDMVAAYRHGPDLGLGEGNWDYVVVGDFATVEDYQAYATDADHRAFIGELIAPNISGRAAVQFEI
jgi:hypothetical protein